MYEEFLGAGYHIKIRKMLCNDIDFLPDSIIDADLNIGAMKQIICKNVSEWKITDEKKLDQLTTAAVYILCSVLCSALRSRSSIAPYNESKYQKNWDKKRKKYMEKGYLILGGLNRNV